ncbi:MAG: hypothetical protein GYB68_03745 [Chloroflexi bacterium]|nr:hypothetical protein [Chloroflexota bacterium]
MHFRVVSIPLNRPDILGFLTPPPAQVRGRALHILDQLPTEASYRSWLNRLQTQPDLATLLSIHHPLNNVIMTHTDRLVPVEFLLNEADYLTRNLGGWAPIYFAVIAADEPWTHDPLLKHARILADYGPDIRSLGPDIDLVQQRMVQEMGLETSELITSIRVLAQGLDAVVGEGWGRTAAQVDWLLSQLAQDAGPPLLWLYALLDRLVRIEQHRRSARADGDEENAGHIAQWQNQLEQEYGLNLILKGEYIMGRHRRSTILLAPHLGVVIKQPGLEPFHEAELSAHIHQGQAENWPRLTHNGVLVTAAGRVRLIVEDGLVERLSGVFDHDIRLSTVMGLIVEPFVVGPTLQDAILSERSRLTRDLYETVVLHQQVCELMGIENGDWHSANFILVDDDRQMVHVDWGAARPLRAEERNAEGERQRVDQVRNIAFSFHDERLAGRVSALHEALLTHPERLQQLKQAAQAMILKHERSKIND